MPPTVAVEDLRVEDLRVGDRFMLPQYSRRICEIYRIELGESTVSIYCYGVDYVLHCETNCVRMGADDATAPDMIGDK